MVFVMIFVVAVRGSLQRLLFPSSPHGFVACILVVVVAAAVVAVEVVAEEVVAEGSSRSTAIGVGPEDELGTGAEEGFENTEKLKSSF